MEDIKEELKASIFEITTNKMIKSLEEKVNSVERAQNDLTGFVRALIPLVRGLEQKLGKMQLDNMKIVTKLNELDAFYKQLYDPEVKEIGEGEHAANSIVGIEY